MSEPTTKQPVAPTINLPPQSASDLIPDYLDALNNKKTLVLIDGSNLYGSTKQLGFDVDFKKLLAFFRASVNLVDMHFFATVDLDDQGKSRIIPFLDSLTFSGYSVFRKEVHRSPNSARPRESIDVEMAITAMDAVNDVKDLRNIVIFSGNGDLESLIKSLRRRGIFVLVVSSANTDPPLASMKVRKAANQFVEIQQVMHDAKAAKGHNLSLDSIRNTSFESVNEG